MDRFTSFSRSKRGSGGRGVWDGRLYVIDDVKHLYAETPNRVPFEYEVDPKTNKKSARKWIETDPRTRKRSVHEASRLATDPVHAPSKKLAGRRGRKGATERAPTVQQRDAPIILDKAQGVTERDRLVFSACMHGLRTSQPDELSTTLVQADSTNPGSGVLVSFGDLFSVKTYCETRVKDLSKGDASWSRVTVICVESTDSGPVPFAHSVDMPLLKQAVAHDDVKVTLSRYDEEHGTDRESDISVSVTTSPFSVFLGSGLAHVQEVRQYRATIQGVQRDVQVFYLESVDDVVDVVQHAEMETVHYVEPVSYFAPISGHELTSCFAKLAPESVFFYEDSVVHGDRVLDISNKQACAFSVPIQIGRVSESALKCLHDSDSSMHKTLVHFMHDLLPHKHNAHRSLRVVLTPQFWTHFGEVRVVKKCIELPLILVALFLVRAIGGRCIEIVDSSGECGLSCLKALLHASVHSDSFFWLCMLEQLGCKYSGNLLCTLSFIGPSHEHGDSMGLEIVQHLRDAHLKELKTITESQNSGASRVNMVSELVTKLWVLSGVFLKPSAQKWRALVPKLEFETRHDMVSSQVSARVACGSRALTLECMWVFHVLCEAAAAHAHDHQTRFFFRVVCVVQYAVSLFVSNGGSGVYRNGMGSTGAPRYRVYCRDLSCHQDVIHFMVQALSRRRVSAPTHWTQTFCDFVDKHFGEAGTPTYTGFSEGKQVTVDTNVSCVFSATAASPVRVCPFSADDLAALLHGPLRAEMLYTGVISTIIVNRLLTEMLCCALCSPIEYLSGTWWWKCTQEQQKAMHHSVVEHTFLDMKRFGGLAMNASLFKLCVVLGYRMYFLIPSKTTMEHVKIKMSGGEVFRHALDIDQKSAFQEAVKSQCQAMEEHPIMVWSYDKVVDISSVCVVVKTDTVSFLFF
jgi:hypothetical protein